MVRATHKNGFAGSQVSTKMAGADIAIFGAAHASLPTAYPASLHATAPGVLRRYSRSRQAPVLAPDSSAWDFNQDRPGPEQQGCKLVDLGEVKTTARGATANRKAISTKTHAIVAAGAKPLLLGGDSSVAVPFISGFSAHAPVVVIYLGGHIHWGDKKGSDAFSVGCSLRRASEMSHVWRMVQVGARGQGVVPEEEVFAARQWGAHLFTARRLHHEGLAPVLSSIPEESDCLVILSVDVLACAEMPAVAWPSPGGLSYVMVSDLLAAIAARAHLAGAALVDFAPVRDKTGTAIATSYQLGCELIEHMARQHLSLNA